jgi:hypothetical protein
LLIESIKIGETTEPIPETQRQARRSYLLEQAVTVMRWMEDFDPQNINID